MMRLRSRKWRYGVGTLLVIAALPLGWLRFQSWRAGQRLADIVAELDRTAGRWRLADLEERRKAIPDEKNAARVIDAVRLANAWKLVEKLESPRPAPYQRLNAAQLVDLKEFQEEHGDKIHEARRLSDFPEGRFHVAISPDVISTTLPHVDRIRSLSVALKFDLWWQLEQGDFERAVQSCRAIVHASRTLREEPFLISHLVRLALLRDAATATERLLAQGEPRAALLPPLQQALLDEAEFDGFGAALEGERAAMHQLFDSIGKTGIDLGLLRGASGYRQNWQTKITDRLLSGTAPQSHVWLLQHLTECLAARALPLTERTAKLKELNARVNDAPHLAQLVMSPVWRNCYPNFQRTETQLRCAVVGLAAEQFRQSRGRWPATLDELTPEFLPKKQTDPNSGEPLQWRATADGVVVFSPGPDGVFRGAARDAPTPAAEPDRGGEYEFRLWNPKQRRKD